MPARVIRAEILSSDSLSKVSIEADLVFRSMILLADDFGRFDGRLAILRAAIFPLRPEVTIKKLERWVDELLGLPDSPLRRYVHSDRPYMHLTGWEKYCGQSRRAKKSKFPDPPEVAENEHRASPDFLARAGKSQDLHAGVGVGVGVGGGVGQAQAPESTPTKTQRKTPTPENLSDEDCERVRLWASRREPPIPSSDVGRAWEVYYAKARANGYRHVDHAQAFMNALGAAGNPWALDALRVRKNGPDGQPLSTAQAKAERTKEAAREAVRRFTTRTQQSGSASAITGGFDGSE